MPEQLTPLQIAKAAKLEALDNWHQDILDSGEIVPMNGLLVMAYDDVTANKHNSWRTMRAIAEAATTIEAVNSFDVPKT